MAALQDNSGTTTLARIIWMALGPVAMLLTTIGIVQRGNGWFTVLDLLFFVFLSATLFARYVEFRGGDPRTDMGERATPAHLRRYSVILMSVGFAVWTLANLVGNHLLP